MTEDLARLALQDTIDDLYFHIAEIKRARAMMIRPGTVKSFDAANNQAIVDIGLESHAVDVGSHVGHWNPLVAGQQIMVLCPDGDLSNAMLVHGGYSATFQPPSTRDDEQALVPPGGGSDEKAALRIRKGGLVRAEVASIDMFKILIGDQAFMIKMDALQPTGKD